MGHGIRPQRTGPDRVVLFRFQIRHQYVLVVVDDGHAAAAADIIGMAIEKRYLLCELVGRHPVIVVIENGNVLAAGTRKAVITSVCNVTSAVAMKVANSRV